MKILLLNYEFPPIGGGGSKATFNVATELVAIGHTVDILTSKYEDLKSEEVINGFRVFRVSSWRKGIHSCGMRGAFTFILNASRKLPVLVETESYDILHYFFSLPTGFLTLLPGIHRKIPYIVSLRGSDVPRYDIFNKKLQIFHSLLAPATRRIWQNAHRVVAVTQSLKETARLFMPEQQIEVIPNGVNTEMYCPFPREGDEKGIFRLIAVTRLVERKGVQQLLQAIAALKHESIQLLLVGSGDYEKELKKLCADLQIEKKVSFYGFCDSSDLPKLYAQADVFVLPSLAEAFGNVFAEAMACGLPVIGADKGGIPDLVGKENGILVKPGDVGELTAAIMFLKNNPQVREKMGLVNSEKIAKHYNWRDVTETYLELYTNAVQEGSR